MFALLPSELPPGECKESCLPWLSRAALWVQNVLVPLGGWGLGAAAILDSSLIPFPSAVDVWMITLCVENPYRAPLYILVASIGSVIGASALAFGVSKGEKALLARSVSEEKIEHARQRIERSGFWAIAGGALLPPPAPFKLLVVAAGVLQYPMKKFAVALLAGRLVRYSLEAILAIRFGHQAWNLLVQAGPWVYGALLLILIVGVAAWKLSRKSASPQRQL